MWTINILDHKFDPCAGMELWLWAVLGTTSLIILTINGFGSFSDGSGGFSHKYGWDCVKTLPRMPHMERRWTELLFSSGMSKAR